MRSAGESEACRTKHPNEALNERSEFQETSFACFH